MYKNQKNSYMDMGFSFKKVTRMYLFLKLTGIHVKLGMKCFVTD